MSEKDLSLMAHLMRRAGFGATRGELEEYASRGYDAVLDDLLHPERFPEVEEDLMLRYRSDVEPYHGPGRMYRMVVTRRPLEEKMSLFWHHVFATSSQKVQHTESMLLQAETFRRNGMSDLRTILLDLARDPAMIMMLDNLENHKDQVNENWGRELLELFTMGVGNYTEEDVKMASRAFTGWTIRSGGGRIYRARFVYREDDHDDSVKTFLGETGRFNGEDIIDILVKQPATARFISRHLYNFFVADEPQVPAWSETPPQDPDAIDTLIKAYFDSGAEIRSMLRALFTSDFFKEARSKVKSPAELVAGTIKLAGTHRFREPDTTSLRATEAMGQILGDPPSVEGWHTGKEWIDGGTLSERVNFAVDEVSGITKPGIQDIISRLSSNGGPLSPEEFVDRCLDLVGPLEACQETRSALLRYAESGGQLSFDTEAEVETSSARVGRMLQLIVASREYQFA